jgi:hypothetical protein
VDYITGMMHNARMSKDATITVRVRQALKRRLAERAKREHRSLSAQVAYELERAVARKAGGPVASALGRFDGARLPSDEDFLEVRGALFGRGLRRSPASNRSDT